MKNKKILFFLLPLVVIIWGLIIFRIVEGTENDTASYFNPKQILAIDQKMKAVQDSFELILTYRDPFDLSYPKPKIKPQKISTKVSPIRKEIKEISWPSVKYGGMVKNKKSKKKLGLLKIENREHLVQEEELINDIEIISIQADSIILKYLNIKKSFYQ